MGALVVGLAAAKALALRAGQAAVRGQPPGRARRGRPGRARAAARNRCVALLVSGGHTSLLQVDDVASEITELGATIDDAAGEAYDKVARLLGLPYPGGPHIDRAAAGGDPAAIALPARSDRAGRTSSGTGSTSPSPASRPRWPGRSRPRERRAARPVPVADVAASFQEAVCDVLSAKAMDACAATGATDLLIGGGVAANRRLRELLAERSAAAGDRAADAAARRCAPTTGR